MTVEPGSVVKIPQKALVERQGVAWRVSVTPLNAQIVFRNVKIATSDPQADIDVSHLGKHLYRTVTPLTLTARDRAAKTAAELDSGDGVSWRLAMFAAVEAVIEAEEALTTGDDLRTSEEADASTEMLVEGLFPSLHTVLVMPNGAGKSTIARALALSIASGKEIIPGFRPTRTGPVLYVAGEDGFSQFHSRSLSELSRGVGIDRSSVKHPIMLIATNGRSLAQMSRNLSERAVDTAAVILDSHQALLGYTDGNIRDRDQLFWNAVDTISSPSFTVAHPNRGDRLNWWDADGSIAGSDVNQDRARCRWKGYWQDDDDPAMKVLRRRYMLDNRKYTHGPTMSRACFAIERFQHYGSDTWTTKFVRSGPIVRDGRTADDGMPRMGRPPTGAYGETLAAYLRGARDPRSLAKVLGVSEETAKKRLQRYGEQMAEEVEE